MSDTAQDYIDSMAEDGFVKNRRWKEGSNAGETEKLSPAELRDLLALKRDADIDAQRAANGIYTRITD